MGFKVIIPSGIHNLQCKTMLTAKEVDSCPSSSGEMNHLLPGNFLGRHADALIGNAVVPSEKDIARMVKSRAEGLLDQSDLQCQFFQSAQSPFRFGQVIDFCL